jgi:hypothetical protein
MHRKRSKLSTVGKVKEAVVQSTGNLRTVRSNLTKLRVDCIAFEREQVQSQLGGVFPFFDYFVISLTCQTAADITARQLLEVGTANDVNTDPQYLDHPDYPDMDYDMGREEDYVDEEDGPREEEDEAVLEGNTTSTYEGSAVDAARARIVYW